MTQRIFGFDIGTTSIGFAVIDHDPDNATGSILRMGVRIFPEARDPDGTPLNQQRRQKRMARRQLRRRRQRRRMLNELLHEAGLLPAFGTAAWAAAMAADPYELRSRGLAEALGPHDLGRAIYHLAKRRHFKGRELDAEEPDTRADDDEKEAKSERESVARTLKAEGTTLGALLARRKSDARRSQPPRERRRGVHASREAVVDELERLWAAQSGHHPSLCTAPLLSQLREAIFAQRPVFWRKSTLGKCRFIPDAPLCPRGAWLSQQKRMLEKLNNLALAGGNQRPLDPEERAAILTRLETQASMTWGGVREALKPLYKARGEAGAQKSIRFNLELGGDPSLPGNPLEAKLAGIFGAGWNSHPARQAIRDAVHDRLWSADYAEVGAQRVVILPEAERRQRRAEAADSFIADFGITRDQASALAALTLPTGWEPFSIEALKAFLPMLEQGERFGSLVAGPEHEQWRETVFPEREAPTGAFVDRLPSPARREERERIAQLRNPTVVRSQNELRKVVNNLIAMFGKPDMIRVELAREVGLSKREREEKQSAIRRNERRRKEAARDLEAKGIHDPSRDTIEKWLLWKESQERCPYTGDQISFDALFRTADFEVEHIWPRWRSFDDSFRNKTLCRKDINLAKGNRTPYEFLGHDTDAWAAIRTRLDGMTATRGGVGMAPGKVRRFLAETLPDDFASRQLNDTGYAARQAVGLLKRLWPDLGQAAPVHVEAVTGRVTGQLRKLWSLNNILSDDGEKTRADHRHHAIDALVVACTHQGMTNRLSRYWQQRDDPRTPRPTLSPPWGTIRADAEKAVREIVVSHRVRKKVSGPLHEEMPLGYIDQDSTKNGKVLGIYVKRVPVEKLSVDTLKIHRVDDISRTAKFVVRDDGVRRALLEHLQAAGVPSLKAYPPYPRVGAGGPEIKKARVLTVQQKDLMVPVSLANGAVSGRRTANGFSDPANNHHIALYRASNGKAEFEVVSLYEAARRLSRQEPIVRRERDDAAVFVMSLSQGDALEFLDRAEIRVVQSVWSSGVVVTLHHTDAVGVSVWRPSAGSILSNRVRKISIDPIGRTRPAAD